MKKFIVTTTIYEPSESIKKFNDMKDWTLIIAGDLKTPHESFKDMKGYLHPDEQEKLYPELSSKIGWNCIQRRNISLLHAYKLGADIIAIVDDDNIPLDGWGENLLIGKEITCKVYTCLDCPVFDPLSATNYKHLWHRGFPIKYIHKKNNIEFRYETFKPSIQADLWNGDPDVDAICRMEHSPSCKFNDEDFPYAATQFSPFNSQNTFMLREVIPHFLCFTDVGRMDDIFGSYYTQSKGFRVIYNKASVYQDRNNHNLITDFENEILGYRYLPFILEDVKTNLEKVISEKSIQAFRQYTKEFQ
jgi:hypothetical protein